MDAPCKIQGSIHVFRLVNNMCPGKWVHIIIPVGVSFNWALCQMLGYSPYESSLAPIIVMVGAILFAQK